MASPVTEPKMTEEVFAMAKRLSTMTPPMQSKQIAQTIEAVCGIKLTPEYYRAVLQYPSLDEYKEANRAANKEWAKRKQGDKIEIIDHTDAKTAQMLDQLVRSVKSSTSNTDIINQYVKNLSATLERQNALIQMLIDDMTVLQRTIKTQNETMNGGMTLLNAKVAYIVESLMPDAKESKK